MNQIIKTIKKAKNIAIFTHRKPDPDALGSSVAFCYALKSINKNVDIVLEEKLPENLRIFDESLFKYRLNKNHDYDLFICLDCGSPILLNKYEKRFLEFSNTICIDHHQTRIKIANYEYVNSFVCSTAQIIYDLIKRLNIKISPIIATAIYLGVVGDTGRFLHSNVTNEVFSMCGNLVEAGADMQLVNNKLYKSNSLEKMQLMQILLSKMQQENNITYCCLTLKDYQKSKCLPSVSYDLIDILASISGTNIAIIFNEIKQGLINISFRSILGFNVAFIANHFGGGGHKQASGIKEFPGTVNEVKDKVMDFINKNMGDIKNG